MSRVLADAPVWDTNDACEAVLTEIHDPHARQPLRRVVLGPLPANAVSSRTLIEEAQRKGVHLNAPVGDGVHKGPAGHSVLSPRVFSPPRALRRPSRGVRSRPPPWLEFRQLRRPSPGKQRASPLLADSQTLEAHTAASAERSEGSVIDTSVAGLGAGSAPSTHEPGSPRSSAPDQEWVTEDAPDVSAVSHGTAATHVTAPSIPAWYEQESPRSRAPSIPADTNTIIEPLAASHQPTNPSIPKHRERRSRGRAASLYNLSDPEWQPRSRTRSASVSMRRGSNTPAPHSAQHWLDSGLEEHLAEQVGMLAGGMRWVGRSFEVGDRLFEVLASTQSGPPHGRLVSGPAGPSSRPRTAAPQRSFTMPEGMYKHDEEPEAPPAPVSAPPRPGMPKRTFSEEAHVPQRPPMHRTFSLPYDEGNTAPVSPAPRPILRRSHTEAPDVVPPLSTALESMPMARAQSTPRPETDAAAREKWESAHRLLEDIKPVRPAPPPPMTPEQMQAKPPSRRLTFQRGTKQTSEVAPSPRPRTEKPGWHRRRGSSPGSTPPRRPRASRPAPLPPAASETAAAAATGEPGAQSAPPTAGGDASPARLTVPGQAASLQREPEADVESIESIPPLSTGPEVPESDAATERPSIASIPPLSKAAEDEPSRPATPRKTTSLFRVRASSDRPSSKRHVQFALRPSPKRGDELDVEAEEIAAQALAGGESIPVGAGDQAPRPAEEVLSRHAEPPLPARPLIAQMEQQRASRWRNRRRAAPSEPVLKRDRMLVKVQNTAHVDLPRAFDQLEARKFDIRSSRWTEYMVALRPDRLELWSEASFRGRILGDVDLLKLRHVVPLTPGYTCLSLYSEVDRLFCLTWERGTFEAQGNGKGDGQRHGKHGARPGTHRLRFRRTGSNILIFCARNLTVAADWMWVLYRALGGRAPESLYVHILALSMRIRLPVAPVLRERVLSGELEHLPALAQQNPEALTSEMREELERMTQPKLLAVVLDMVKQLPNWNALVARMRIMGWQPRLVWRSGPVLNWVDMDLTSEGQPRFWSVLAGQLLATHRNVPVLELRTNAHYPGDVSQPQGPMLAEPAATEGFVWRLRPVSGLASRVYLSVHNNCLCVSRATRAYVPDPFAPLPGGLVRGMHVRDREAFLRQYVHSFYERERARCRLQIRNCDGFIDLNEVELVRSVGTGQSICTSASLVNVQKIVQYCGLDLCSAAVHLLREYNGDPAPVVQALAIDTALGGVGDEGMHEVEDRAAVRRMRQFELVLVNGRCVTFECSSAALAQEWGVRLFSLARYWRCRRRTDTWTLMNVAGTRPSDVRAGGAGRSAPLDDSAKFAVGQLWNWCMLDGCRPVLMSGRLFCRSHRRQAYKRYYIMLITGQLVAFSASHSTRSSAARLNQGILYRRLDATVSLRDAYIFTGRVADTSVESDYAPTGTQRRADPHRSKAETQYPRLYRDGLHTADAREDCTFMLRIRKGFDALSAQQNKFRLRPHKKDTGMEMIPGLADKAYGFIQFRARTMMERDLWVRAITHEMERMSRIEVAREQRVRERGKVH